MKTSKTSDVLIILFPIFQVCKLIPNTSLNNSTQYTFQFLHSFPFFDFLL